MASSSLTKRCNLLLKLGAHRRLATLIPDLYATDPGTAAGLPFRMLDQMLSTGQTRNVHHLSTLTEYLPGNQPELLTAILTQLETPTAQPLKSMVTDENLHPLTRFESMGWHVFLSHRLQFNRTLTGSKPVVQMGQGAKPPSTLTQFWDRSTPPPEITEGTAKWHALSGFTHTLFDEHSASDFIATHYGTTAADQFRALWHPAVKSDLFRLYYMSQNGGIYVDADANPGSKLATVPALATNTLLLSAMTSVPNCATLNGFMAAPANHPLVTAYLDAVLRNLSDMPHRKIFWVSGPGALTKFLFQTIGTVAIYPQAATSKHLFHQFNAGYKRTDMNWRVFEHKTTPDDTEILPAFLSDV